MAAAVIGIVWLVIEKTPYGAMIKAGAHDSEMVRALGINLSRLRLGVFVFGTMLAALAGIIIAPIWGIRPHMGVDAVVPAFLIIVLGGIGSFWGAVLGEPARRARRRPFRRLRVGVVAAVDVPAAGRRRVGQGARPVRQEEPAGGLRDIMTGTPSTARLITPTMLGAWLLLATVPLVDQRGRALSLYRRRDPDLVDLCARLQSGARDVGPAVVRPRRPTSASAPTPSASRSSMSPQTCGSACSAPHWPARLAGLIVGLFISHRRGIYFALMTIAFGQIFWTISMKSHSITGGEDGLLNILRLPANFGFVAFDITENDSLYYFVLAMFAVVVVLLWRLVNSPYGRILAAIRQSETRTAHLGYNVWLYKLSVIVISGAFSGFAGGLFAMAQRSAFPDVMNLAQSGLVVMMTLVGGGLVSFWGPVIGVIVFLISRDVIGAWTSAWMLYFGAMFVLLVLFRPEGIAGYVKIGARTLEGAQHALVRALGSASRSG